MSELYEQKPNSIKIEISDEENERADEFYLAGRDFDEVVEQIKSALTGAPRETPKNKRKSRRTKAQMQAERKPAPAADPAPAQPAPSRLRRTGTEPVAAAEPAPF